MPKLSVAEEEQRHPELARIDPLTKRAVRKIQAPPKHRIHCSNRMRSNSKMVSAEFTCQAGVATAHEYIRIFMEVSELYLVFMASGVLIFVLRYLDEG